MTKKEKEGLAFYRPDLTTAADLPMMFEAVAVGFPTPADDFLDTPLDLNKELIRNPSATFIVKVSGDSMTGAGIADGDLLIVDRSVAVYDGCIAVCYVDEEFIVKRIRLEGGDVWLQPAHDRRKAIRVTVASGILIWGIVVHCIKTFC